MRWKVTSVIKQINCDLKKSSFSVVEVKDTLMRRGVKMDNTKCIKFVLLFYHIIR